MIGCSLAGNLNAQMNDRLIGYSELRTDLPGGQAVNWFTMRAWIVQADGTGRRELAHNL